LYIALDAMALMLLVLSERGKQAANSQSIKRCIKMQGHHFTLGAKLDAGGLFETASLSHQKNDRSKLTHLSPHACNHDAGRLPYLPF